MLFLYHNHMLKSIQLNGKEGKPMAKANMEIRWRMQEDGTPVWKLADFFKCHENTMLRRLRHELSASEKAEVLKALDAIRSGK